MLMIYIFVSCGAIERFFFICLSECIMFPFHMVCITFQKILARLVIIVLMELVFRGQIHVLKQHSARTELIHLLYVVSQM